MSINQPKQAWWGESLWLSHYNGACREVGRIRPASSSLLKLMCWKPEKLASTRILVTLPRAKFKDYWVSGSSTQQVLWDVPMCRGWYKEERLVNWRQGHGSARILEVLSYRTTVVQTAENINIGHSSLQLAVLSRQSKPFHTPRKSWTKV